MKLPPYSGQNLDAKAPLCAVATKPLVKSATMIASPRPNKQAVKAANRTFDAEDLPENSTSKKMLTRLSGLKPLGDLGRRSFNSKLSGLQLPKSGGLQPQKKSGLLQPPKRSSLQAPKQSGLQVPKQNDLQIPKQSGLQPPMQKMSLATGRSQISSSRIGAGPLKVSGNIIGEKDITFISTL